MAWSCSVFSSALAPVPAHGVDLPAPRWKQDGSTAEQLARSAGRADVADMIAAGEVAAELLRACENGDAEGVRRLLRGRRELVGKVLRGELAPDGFSSPLLVAAKGGHAAVVQALLEAGAPLPAEVSAVAHGLRDARTCPGLRDAC